MRVLIIGAGGFIGRRVALTLQRSGHEIVPCGRHIEHLRRLFPDTAIVPCDFTKDRVDDWRARLSEVDAVINAAGIFQPTRGNDFEQVHIQGPKALFQACAAENIPKLIHISALGADAAAETAFHLSKRDADDCCVSLANEHGFDSWVVVRPSLVIGRGGYSTTLFAALAALPWPPRLGPGNWQVQPIHIADLCEAIRLMLTHDGPLPRQLDLAGPSPMTTDDLTRSLRRWLCLSPARLISLPEIAIEGTLSADTLKMLKRGNTASIAPLAQALSWQPRPLDEALAEEPSSQADLWHARLFLLKPALRLGLAFLWLSTAIISAFIFPIEKSQEMVAGLGLTGWQASAIVYAGAAWDGLLGMMLLLRIRPVLTGFVQIATIAVFTVLGTLAVPFRLDRPIGTAYKEHRRRAGHSRHDYSGGRAMSYLLLKYIHILSSTLLFGTGLGTAFHGYLAFRSRDAKVIASVGRSVILADWLFTAPAVIIQPATGVAMALMAGWPLTSGWLALSIVLYIVVGACWLPVVWLQIQLRALARQSCEKGAPLPPLYFRYLRVWFILGWPAFTAVLAIFYLMIVKPDLM